MDKTMDSTLWTIIDELRAKLKATEDALEHEKIGTQKLVKLYSHADNRFRNVISGLDERMYRALTEIACFDDDGANASLEKYGTYGTFDEPSSVEIARKVLNEIDVAADGCGIDEEGR